MTSTQDGGWPGQRVMSSFLQTHRWKIGAGVAGVAVTGYLVYKVCLHGVLSMCGVVSVGGAA